MPTRYVHNGTSFVVISSSGVVDASVQYIGSLLPDQVDTASSVRNSFTLTASATPHAGTPTWTEIDPSLSAASSGLYINIQSAVSSSAADSSALFEIATGASGAEAVWATVPVGYREAGSFRVPGHLNAGTRVAMRCRSAIASLAVVTTVSFLSEKSTALGVPVTYGASTATSHGVALTTPVSLNTKSAWTPITTSTTAVHNALFIGVQANGSTNMSSTGVLVDIGIGATGAETVLVSDLFYAGNTQERYAERSPVNYGVDIPSGSQLSARYARNNTNNAVDVILVAA